MHGRERRGDVRMKIDRLHIIASARALGLFVLSFAVFILPVMDSAFSAQISYRRDTTFEGKIKGIYNGCLPEPAALTRHNYAYNVAGGLINECVINNANTLQGIKYSVLLILTAATAAAAGAAGAVSGGTAVPALTAGAAATAPFISGYLGGEATTDGIKCTLKAFVEASSSMSPKQKASVKALVDGALTLKDWRSFSNSIPEIANSSGLKSLQGTVESVLAVIERAKDARDLGEFAIDMSRQGTRAASNYYFGKSRNEFDDARLAISQCRFQDAEKSRENALKAAREECREKGIRYRLAESKLQSHISAHSRGIAAAQFDPSDYNTLVYNDYVYLNNKVLSQRAKLDKFAKIFGKLDKLKTVLEKRRKGFDSILREYQGEVWTARRARESTDICLSIDKLKAIANKLSNRCREQLFSSTGHAPAIRPGDLYLEFASVARAKSQEWWDQIERIRNYYYACNISAASAAITALKAQIAARPIFRYVDNQCKKIEQSDILKRLAAFKTPKYCLDRKIPDLTGLGVSEAHDRLYEANFVPGKTKVEKPASAEQTPGTVIRSDPPANSLHKALTSVTLFIFGARAADDLVEMPVVIGLAGEEARGKVAAAGLVPTVDTATAADDLNEKPGIVYGADHSAGDRLPRETSVVLKVYGSRPEIPVPDIAGLSLEAARGALSGKKFIAADPTLGDPAPKDKEPGMIYASIPASGTVTEIFTEVQPVIYGPRENNIDQPAVNPEPGPEKPVQEAGEGSWIGRWSVHGMLGKKMRVDTILAVTNEPAGTFVTVMNRKHQKNRWRFAVSIDGNILITRPRNIIQGNGSTGDARANAFDLGTSAVMGKISRTLSDLLKNISFKITRQASDCLTIIHFNIKGKNQEIRGHLTCTRM